MMTRLYHLSSATYQDVSRSVFYNALVLATAGLILLGPSMTLFYFSQTGQAIRDISLSSVTVTWVLLSIVTLSYHMDRERRFGGHLLIFSKPVSRATFLLGKFLGLVRSLGMAALLFFFLLAMRLWLYEKQGVLEPAASSSVSPFHPPSFYGAATAAYIHHQIFPLLIPFLLGFLQALLLGFLLTLLSFHGPLMVTLPLGLGLYAVGHFYPYVEGRIFPAGAGGWSWIGRHVISPFLPDFSRLNGASMLSFLPDVNGTYWMWAMLYALGYILVIFFLYLLLFSRSEIKVE